jgi:hypothetical protein
MEKRHKKILVVIYGSEYWNKVVSYFQAMVDAGVISQRSRLGQNSRHARRRFRNTWWEGLDKNITWVRNRRTTGELAPEIAKTRCLNNRFPRQMAQLVLYHITDRSSSQVQNLPVGQRSVLKIAVAVDAGVDLHPTSREGS